MVRPAVLGTLLGAGLAAASMLWSCTVERPSESFRCAGQADCDAGRICTNGYCVIGSLPADARPLDAAVCPAACDSCDFATTTCQITGTGSGSGNITCPSGWNCNIECPTSNACGMISCTSAASCEITCTAANACPGISCNTRDCRVECVGSQACGNVTCTSGDCDVTCTGSAACGNITCTSGDCRTNCSGGSAACGTLTCGTGRCDATCIGSDPACGDVSCASSCRCDVSCDGATNACPAVMMCPDDAPGADYCTADGSNGSRCSSSFSALCNDC